MPDALSKTIPIWCSVLNRLLFPTLTESHQLYTPPQVVSQSEHAQITALIPSFVAAIQALNLPVKSLRSKISKPLRPMWLTPESNIEQTESVFEDFHPIICCTVSRRVAGGELSEGGYIQGAGDDTENWAHGLTPSIFWANREFLLSTPEQDLPDLIGSLVKSHTNGGSAAKMIRLQPTSCLFVGALEAASALCTVALLPKISDQSTWRVSSTRLDVGLGPHKIGSRNLRMALPIIVSFVKENLASVQQEGFEGFRLLIACETGRDISIGVSLVLLCLLFKDDGKLLGARNTTSNIDKTFIRRRLGLISASVPDANPSRATLQSANSYLMERP
jgi:tRNA A64-2'-O-ribosylphosphate transferase